MTLSLEAHQATQTPSKWTLLQRRLFDAIGDAAPQALERYTHPDGRQVFTKVKVDEASGGVPVSDKALELGLAPQFGKAL